MIDKIIENQRAQCICEVANDNCPGQVVLSGKKKDVDNVAEICLKKGAKRIIDLNVKMLAQIALLDRQTFSSIVSQI